ncbi:hypothetical protein [Myceligenerans crystallogenes]|uniref:Uncharacterized protein n=1 Tax=Myceligenerans crystallogenes TaxID=316335 RepID=A0ABP4ZPD0_9MICO
MHHKILNSAMEAAKAGLRMKRMHVEFWFIECPCGWSTKIHTPSQNPGEEAAKIDRIFGEHRAHL